MGVKTLDSFGSEEQARLSGWTAQPVILVTEGTDGILRVPTTDSATGSLPVAIVSGGGGATIEEIERPGGMLDKTKKNTDLIATL